MALRTETLAEIQDRGAIENEYLEWHAFPIDGLDLDLERIVVHTDRLAKSAKWAGLSKLLVHVEDGEKGDQKIGGLSSGGGMGDILTGVTSVSIPAPQSRRVNSGGEYVPLLPWLETTTRGKSIGHIVVNENGILDRVRQYDEDSWAREVNATLRKDIRGLSYENYFKNAPTLVKAFAGIFAVNAADSAVTVPKENISFEHVAEFLLNIVVPGIEVLGDPESETYLSQFFDGTSNLGDFSNAGALTMVGIMHGLHIFSSFSSAYRQGIEFDKVHNKSLIAYGFMIDRVLMTRVRTSQKLVSVKK